MMPFLPPASKPPKDPYRPKRKTTTERGYGADHQKARLTVLAEEPVCSFCGLRLSEQMHHRDGNVFNTNRDNLTGICAPCHIAHHKSERANSN